MGIPVVVDNERDCFEKNTVLGIGMLNFFRFGRLLSLVQNGLQTLIKPATNSRIIRRRVVLQQSQQFDRQPRRGHEIIRVILEVCVARSHDL